MFANVLMIFAAMLSALLIPLGMNQLHDARVDTYEQTFGLVATADNVSTANITPSLELWQGKVTSILSVSSNVSGDLPSASSYSETSGVLTIDGLSPSLTRTLTVVYEIASGSLEEQDAAVYFIWFIVIFYLLSTLALFGGGTYGIFKECFSGR